MLNTKKDETERVNPFAYVPAGLVANNDQSTNNPPSRARLETCDIWPCAVCVDRDVYLEGLIWPLKAPHVEGVFYPNLHTAGFSLKHLPPIILIENTSVYHR